MKYFKKSKAEIDSKLESKLLKLTYKYGGMMKQEYHSLGNRGKPIGIAYNGNTPIGWCIFTEYVFMVYILPKYRRCGVATELFRMMSKNKQWPTVFEHTSQSRLFFKSIGYQC